MDTAGAAPGRAIGAAGTDLSGPRRGRRDADRSDSIRGFDRHLPEDAVVLHPGGALDHRSDVELVGPWRLRRLDRELEPRNLTGPHIVGGLRCDTVVSRPSGRRRSELPVAPDQARLILARAPIGGAEERHLAHTAADPAGGTRVVV